VDDIGTDDEDVGEGIADLPRLQWEPIGLGGRVRLTACDEATGDIIDIDTLDVSRAADRIAYARRGAALFRAWKRQQFEQALLGIAEERLRPQVEVARTITLAAALDEWAAHEDEPRIATQFSPLDELLGGGLPHGSLTVLAGPPGCGKSALALQVVIGALLADRNLKSLWGLGEMSREALAGRAVAVGSALLGADAVTMAEAKRRAGDARAVADQLKNGIGDRLGIVSPLTIDNIVAAIDATGARLVVVDYLQLVRVADAADRRQEVDAVVRALRELTVARGLAVVAVSNISKGVGRDTRAGGVGKESSEIDFAADLLLLAEPDDDVDEDGLRPVRWRCMKNRHGAQRNLETILDGGLQLFTVPEAQVWPEFVPFADRGRP